MIENYSIKEIGNKFKDASKTVWHNVVIGYSILFSLIFLLLLYKFYLIISGFLGRIIAGIVSLAIGGVASFFGFKYYKKLV